jgi:mono/diheme cytochrome c family protein
MKTRELILPALVLVSLALTGCGKADAPVVSYSQDIQPILDQHCTDCHTDDGAGVAASGFRTDSHAAVMAGTRFGPMIEPGDPLSSSLYRLVSGREIHPSIQMPHGDAKMPDAEIELIERWIKQGALDN